MFKNAGQAVGDGSHDEAVEQRDVPRRPGSSEDSPGRNEAEIGQRLAEPRPPDLAVGRLLRLGYSVCNAVERGGKVGIFARIGAETVFLVPDFFSERRVEGHGNHPYRWLSEGRSGSAIRCGVTQGARALVHVDKCRIRI